MTAEPRYVVEPFIACVGSGPFDVPFLGLVECTATANAISGLGGADERFHRPASRNGRADVPEPIPTSSIDRHRDIE